MLRGIEAVFGPPDRKADAGNDRDVVTTSTLGPVRPTPRPPPEPIRRVERAYSCRAEKAGLPPRPTAMRRSYAMRGAEARGCPPDDGANSEKLPFASASGAVRRREWHFKVKMCYGLRR